MQPMFWTAEDGRMRQMGRLHLLAGNVLHVDSEYLQSTTSAELPWYLAPLKAQGFLGRLLAQRLAELGVPGNPEVWDLETDLYAALHLHDAPGAITIGEPARQRANATPLSTSPAKLAAALDAHASDVAVTLPAGSSAGGEQPKFLAALETGQHVLVKFTPPRGTPFGDRWRDLLHAEALASSVLAEHGFDVARSHVVESALRTYLISERFDRVGERGRRHVVSIGAVHKAFVPGSFWHWGASCDALAHKRQLPAEDARRANLLLHFGRLIGNSDMHSGNLGLFNKPEGLAKGAFTLAPVYDMLPMRWRPNVDQSKGRTASPEYSPFEPDPVSAASAAAAPAHLFWSRLMGSEVSPPLRRVAKEMRARIHPSANAPESP